MAAVEDRLATAYRQTERLNAAKEELERRIEVSTATESQQERASQYAAAKLQADAGNGCGMTVRQFNKLPGDKQQEVHRAYLALMSPSNIVPPADPEPADTRAIPRGHLSIDQKLAVGRWLLHNKASLPHGHLRPWLDRQQGLARSMAQQCMSLAGARQGDC